MERRKIGGPILAALILARTETAAWVVGKALDGAQSGALGMNWAAFPWADATWIVLAASCLAYTFWPEFKAWWRKPSETELLWAKTAQDDAKMDSLLTTADTINNKIQERLLVLEATVAVLNMTAGDPITKR